MADLAAAFEGKARAIGDGRIPAFFDDLSDDFEAMEHCFERSRSLLYDTAPEGESGQA